MYLLNPVGCGFWYRVQGYGYATFLDINITDIPTRVPMEATSLTVTGNYITTIPTGVFSNLRKCLSLDLSSNNFTELRKGMFKGLRSVRGLFLDNNEISYIGPRSFAPLRKCEHLSLNNNRITDIQPSMWNGLVSLVYLYLQNNGIHTLQSEAFRATSQTSKTRGLTNGILLDLSGNGPIRIEAGAFSGLNLGTLYVSLEGLPEGLWNGVKVAYSLRLFGGNFTELRSYMFKGVESLHDISFNRNQINQIEDGTFSKFNACEDLWLDQNDLSNIRAGMWEGLISLDRLAINFNKLTEVRRDMWWKGMKQLRILWLNENNITRIEDGAFRRLRRVRDIRLYGNRLTALRPGMWRGLRYLRAVTLSQNWISVIKIGTFANLPKLRSIGLDYNMLTTITDVFYGGYAGQYAYIHLGGNPIHCDSSLCWAKKPEYKQRVQVQLRFCRNENETSCYFENIISEMSQCLNVCKTQLIGSEGDDADENSNDDVTPDTYSNGDIDTSVTVSLDSEVDDVTANTTTMEVVHNDDAIDDDAIDDDAINDDAIGDDAIGDDDDVQIQQNDTNVPEGILFHSTGSVLASDGSTKERMMERKTNVSNVSQSTGGDGVITKIWRMVKALLKAVKNFWFKTTGGQ